MNYLGRCEVIKIDDPYVIFGIPRESMALIEEDEKVFRGHEKVPRNQVMNREYIEEGNLGNIYSFGHYHKVIMDPQDVHERALNKSNEQIKYKEGLLDEIL